MRLDNYLVEKKYFDSRTKAKQAIERGEVYINGKKLTKPSYEINLDEVFDVKLVFDSQYVSLGGYKMEKALKDFNFKVNELICADIGCSTGGFTDCLLQNGAKKIYAIDVNENLLHPTINNNNKVEFLLKNARNLTSADFNDKLDLIVADLSFISLSLVLDVFSNLLEDQKYLLILIKPQFETGEKKRFKNGIIRDGKLHRQICNNVIEQAKNHALFLQNFTIAPEYKEKNREFLMLFQKNGVETYLPDKLNI